jgi:general secretion pathway protein A
MEHTLPAYLRYWGLNEPPFSLAPNPQMFYLSDQHRECLMRLKYAIHSGKGGALLISENAGDGKTTTLNLLMQEIVREEGRVTRVAYLDYPTMTPTQMVGEIARQLGVEDIKGDKVEDINALRDLLRSNHIRGVNSLVIVDEGQMLSNQPDLLQELRILLNFCTAGEFLLTFILSGQAPLEPAVRSMPEFWQRLPVRFFLKNLHLKDTCGMIAHRMQVAGAEREIFTETAMEGIFRYSHGCPRVICAVADLSLVIGHSNRARQVDFAEVTQACSDMEHSGASYHYFNFLEGEIKPPEAANWVSAPVARPVPAPEPAFMPAPPPPAAAVARDGWGTPAPEAAAPAAPPEPTVPPWEVAPAPASEGHAAYPPPGTEAPAPFAAPPTPTPPSAPEAPAEPAGPVRTEPMTCRACGKRVNDDIEACPGCGAALKVACERCRSPQSALLKRCAHCGYPLHTWAREAEREFLAGLKRLNLYRPPKETDQIKFHNHRTLDGRVLYFAASGNVLRQGAQVREVRNGRDGRLKPCGVIIGNRRLVFLTKERPVDIPLSQVNKCDTNPESEGGVLIHCGEVAYDVRFPVREGRRTAFCRLVQSYLNRMAGT